MKHDDPSLYAYLNRIAHFGDPDQIHFEDIHGGRLARQIWIGLWVVMALACGYVTMWGLYESDIFLQVKFGYETLVTGQIQTRDTWSHTMPGGTFYNYQWLSCVILALVHKLFGGWSAFPVFRAILVTTWVAGLGAFVHRKCTNPFAAVLVGMILIPLIYVICHFRLQMRPDLFAINMFLYLLLLLDSSLSETVKRVSGVLLLVVWSNLHAGTSPFGIAVLWIYVFNSFLNPKGANWRDVILLLGLPLLWFATPIGTKIVTVVAVAAFNYDYSFTKNPDMQPFSLQLLTLEWGGWSFIFLAGYIVTAVLSFWILWRKTDLLLRQKVFYVCGSILFLLLTVQKTRVTPYFLTFTLPVVLLGLNWLIDQRGKWLRFSTISVFGLLGLHFVFFVAPVQLLVVGRPLVRDVLLYEMPVRSVEFIKKYKPLKNLLNAYPHGGYIEFEAPEYPTSIDSREPLFDDFRHELFNAQLNHATEELLEKYQINTIVVRPPFRELDHNGQMADQWEVPVDPKRWAFVFMDSASIVYVRRISEHDHIIRRFEFTHIRRSHFPQYVLQIVDNNEKHSIAREMDMCLADCPDNYYCLTVKALIELSFGHFSRSRALLLKAFEIHPRSPEVLLALIEVDKAMGRTTDVRKWEYRHNLMIAN